MICCVCYVRLDGSDDDERMGTGKRGGGTIQDVCTVCVCGDRRSYQLGTSIHTYVPQKQREDSTKLIGASGRNDWPLT